MHLHFRRCVAVAAALLPLSACLDRGSLLDTSTDLPDRDPSLQTTVSCVVDISAAAVTCAQPSGGGDQALIIGEQGRYVQLTSSNIEVVDSIFGFDVTVQNLIHQVMGTRDGVTADSAGIRVFFSREPVVTSGAGTIRVRNADGRDIFVEADRLYYQYAGLLPHNAVSDPRRWEFVFDEGVDSFAFNVYVATEVQYAGTYIDLSENRTHFLQRPDTGLFAGVIRDAFGNELEGDIVWSTDNPGVATIDSRGVLRPQDLGFTTVRATSGDASGEWEIGICYLSPPPEFGASEYDPPNRERFCLGTGDRLGEFTLVPVNASLDATAQITTTVSGIGPVVGPPTPALFPGRPSFHRADVSSVADLHARGAVRGNASRGLAPGRMVSAIVPNRPSVGDIWELTVASDCSTPGTVVHGRVEAVGEHAIVVADTLNAPAPPGFYGSVAVGMDTLAPVVYSNFNYVAEDTLREPTDIDSNGAVVYLISQEVTNQLNPAVSGEFGYFATRDLETTATCANSNQGEIIYVAGENSSLSFDLLGPNLARTMVHELQHLLNYSYRSEQGYDPEEPWLDEAMSVLAEELTYLDVERLSVMSNIGGDEVFGSSVDSYESLLRPTFNALESWLAQPHMAGVTAAPTSAAGRAAAYAFLRYYVDQTAGTTDQRLLTTALVRSPGTGMAKLASMSSRSAGDLLVNFASAMYADDAGIASLVPKLKTYSWNYRSIYTAGPWGGFPLATAHVEDGEPFTRTYAPGGGSSFLRFGAPRDSFIEINNSVVGGGSVPASMRFKVIRTQ